MRKYDILLFDLDGTLTDSAPGVYNGFRRALGALGIEPPGFEEFKKCMGPPLSYSLTTFFGLEGERLGEAMRTYLAYSAARGFSENSVFPGVEDALARINAAGYTMAIASTKAEAQVHDVLRQFGLERYFHFLAGSRDDLGRSSKSDVIRHIIEALPIPDVSRALMIGDRLYDVEGARSCGMDTLGVLWGYGTAEELKTAGAARLSPTPAELADYLGAY